MAEEIWTIQKLLVWTTDFFTRKGIESPRRTAEVLLAHVLKMDRVRLYMEFDRPLSEEEKGGFRDLVKRRAARVPTDYLTGHRCFLGHDFAVDSRVLVPRPETEQLVELALSRLPGGNREPNSKFLLLQKLDVENLPPDQALGHPERESPSENLEKTAEEMSRKSDVLDEKDEKDEKKEVPRLLDLCTGSGCVGISAALARTDLTVVATDISAEALQVARANGVRLKVQDRMAFFQGDLFDALPDPAEKFHVIVSNPPYVPRKIIETLSPEVRQEPQLALDGGVDGLDVLKRIIQQAHAHLLQGGTLCLEMSEEHEVAVKDLLVQAGFVEVRVDRDFAGLPRIASGRWLG